MTLRANVLSVTSRNKRELFEFAAKENLRQFSFSFEEDLWVMSAPLSPEARSRYGWLYERNEVEKGGIAKE